MLQTFRAFTAAQNVVSSLMFAFLAAAHASAVLVYLGIRGDWTWFLSIHLNRLAEPVLDIVYKWGAAGPFVGLLVLLGLCMLPMWAGLRRNWLGTAVAGHLALGTGILSYSAEIQRAASDIRFASIGNVQIGFAHVSGPASMLALTVVLALFCIINHIVFFAEHRHSVGR